MYVCYSFEGVSDSRHPGPGAREGGSAREILRSIFRRRLSPALSLRFARNGGYRSIEESEILNLSTSPEGFGVISGRAFLHGFKGRNADLNTVLRQDFGARSLYRPHTRAQAKPGHTPHATCNWIFMAAIFMAAIFMAAIFMAAFFMIGPATDWPRHSFCENRLELGPEPGTMACAWN